MVESSELRSLIFFGSFTDQELEAVSRIVEKKSYADNTAIFLEGLPGESLYILTEGKVKISKMLAEGEEKEIAVLSSGDSFGELALLDSGPRLATARVREAAEVMTIRNNDVTALMTSEPLIYSKLVCNIAKQFTARLRDSSDRIKEIIRG